MAALLVAGYSAHAQGKLEIVGGDVYDWGTVYPAVLKSVVELKNVGNEELKITEVRPTCLCTVAPIDKDVLKPGESARVSIELNVTNRTGILERNILITSSDTAQSRQTLRLRANVKRDLTFTPAPYITVHNVKVGVEAQASPLRIANTSDQPITIDPPALIEGKDIAIRFSLTEPRVLKPGEEIQMQAYVTVSKPAAPKAKVAMKTDCKQYPVVEFSVSGVMAREDASRSQK